jgi:adenosine kinase
MSSKPDPKAVKEGMVVGVGNPLLDISANVEEEFLKKYGLYAKDQIMATEKHKDLTKDMVKKYKVKYTAGGSVQNSLRVMQWFYEKTPLVATYMGCVGEDDFRKQMETKAKEDRINVLYMVDKKEPTGTCACLITDNGKKRSLCAYLGASLKFNAKHINENIKVVEKSKYCFSSGYHLAVCSESVLLLAKHCDSQKDKVFVFTLSASFVCTKYSKQLQEIYPYVDYLFANESEAVELAEAMGWSVHEIRDIAKFMADKDVNKTTKKRKRTVIVTQGTGPVIVAVTQTPEVKEFETLKISADKVVDTTGAGDAFVGGFLAQLIQKQPIDVCVRSGIYAATEIIQQSGCNFPKQNTFKV